jgi:hypothetical protein
MVKIGSFDGKKNRVAFLGCALVKKMRKYMQKEK